ncbi:MAG: segregation/condensation protein A [Lachnospiraceae bacterium]|nr:segregation/condensation protein A [Lachnospiraceae bacterium]
MDIAFKLSAFEGPLDLLLHLIEKNKVDIYDIPISMITDQYLEYLAEMDKHDAEVTSEFLVMAATLLDIKAKMLLPKEVDAEGNEEDPRAELVQKLIEYKMYKFMSVELKDKAITASKAMFKGATIPEEVAQYEPPIDLDVFVGNVTIAKLKAVFDDVVKRNSELVNVEAMRYGRIQREAISIPDKIAELREFIGNHKQFSFREFIERQRTKMNIIVSFLAILELMKTGEIWAEQDGNDNDIILYTEHLEEKIGNEQDESDN